MLDLQCNRLCYQVLYRLFRAVFEPAQMEEHRQQSTETRPSVQPEAQTSRLAPDWQHQVGLQLLDKLGEPRPRGVLAHSDGVTEFLRVGLVSFL